MSLDGGKGGDNTALGTAGEQEQEPDTLTHFGVRSGHILTRDLNVHTEVPRPGGTLERGLRPQQERFTRTASLRAQNGQEASRSLVLGQSRLCVSF